MKCLRRGTFSLQLPYCQQNIPGVCYSALLYVPCCMCSAPPLLSPTPVPMKDCMVVVEKLEQGIWHLVYLREFPAVFYVLSLC
jgi:hypothetical protein